MAKFKKYETGQDYSPTINLGDYLATDHLAKKIEYIVSHLDTSKIESSYKKLGPNAYHPKMMLSIIFYGYAVGVRSGRKLANYCKENLAFLYLSRGYQPSKSTFNDFRKDYYTHFEDLFSQVLAECLKVDLGDPSLSIIDGSKIRANSSKKRTKTKEKYEKWLNHLQEDITALEQELDVVSKKKLNKTKKLILKIEAAINRLSANDNEKNYNLTDADAPIMKGKKKNFDTYYNVQVACSEDQIISFCDVVTKGNDKAQLIPTLKGIAANTNRKIKQVLADGDYGNFASLEYMDKQGIEGFVPYKDIDNDYANQSYHTKHFIYDAQTDTYTCPNAKVLDYYKDRVDKDREQEFKCFRTKATSDCTSCPFQKDCVPKGRARRVIEREKRQDLKDEMKQRLTSPEGKAIYRKRLHPIESIFGHLKHNLGYYQFLLRGLAKVKAEFILMCISHNLRKLTAKVCLVELFMCVIALLLGYEERLRRQLRSIARQ